MEKIKIQRQKEIDENANLYTSNPLYIVYSQTYTVCEHDTEYSQSTSLFKEHDEEYVRYNNEGETIEAEKDSTNWHKPLGEWSKVVKKSYHDRFITVCFTRKAAEEFIEAEKHNLANPRIYVRHAEPRNKELQHILKILGD